MTVDHSADVHIGGSIGASLNQWDAMAADLSSAWPDIAARVRELNAAQPWGDGPDGRSFVSRYLSGGGPEKFLRETDVLIGEISGSGPLLHATVSNTLTTDQATELGLTNVFHQA